MARDFYVNGECLVKVKFGAHITPSNAELGLAADQVRVVPRWAHADMRVDDFGPDIPMDLMVNLVEVYIHMQLIHFDATVLNRCMGESMGGAVFSNDLFAVGAAGGLAGAGTLMRGGASRGDSNYHFIGLNLTANTALGGRPWRFPTASIVNETEFPLGTKKSIVDLKWRAIPYYLNSANGEIMSSGAIIFDRTLDF